MLMSIFMIPVALISILLPVALVLALQVWLCKKGGKLGLILPGLTLALSLVMCLSFAGFSTRGTLTMTSYDQHGNIVEEHHQEVRHPIETAEAAALGGMFLVSNIPTVVFGGIWLYYRNRREWKDDLKKMKIEDLE